MKYSYILLGLISLLSVEAGAKELLTDVTISNNRVEVKESKLYVDFEIDISEVDIRSDHSVILTPTIIAGGRVKNLPEVVLNGRNSQIAYNRVVRTDRKQPAYSEPYKVMRLEKGSQTIIPYTMTIPFEGWMENSTLTLKQQVSLGCKDNMLDVSNMVVEQDLQAPYPFTPELTYLFVTVLPTTVIQESESASIFFPINVSQMDDNYRDNRVTLAKIDTILSDYLIDHIGIVGSASPEGKYQPNIALSQQRALTLAAYFDSHYSVPVEMEKVDWVGENWKSLVQFVKKSDMNYRDEVLAIIENVDIFSGREKSLMELRGGVPYNYIYDNFFPELRRASYRVYFRNRPFDVAKVGGLIKSNPKSVSAEQMLILADTYPRNSAEYREVMELAVEQYPDNVMANINMSSILIGKGELEMAMEYLDKFKDNPSSWNNMGIIYMVDGDRELAYKYLQKAIESGSIDATNNMKELNHNKNNYLLQLN